MPIHFCAFLYSHIRRPPCFNLIFRSQKLVLYAGIYGKEFVFYLCAPGTFIRHYMYTVNAPHDCKRVLRYYQLLKNVYTHTNYTHTDFKMIIFKAVLDIANERKTGGVPNRYYHGTILIQQSSNVWATVN